MREKRRRKLKKTFLLLASLQNLGRGGKAKRAFRNQLDLVSYPVRGERRAGAKNLLFFFFFG